MAKFTFCSTCNTFSNQTGRHCHKCSADLASYQTHHFPGYETVEARQYASDKGMYFVLLENGSEIYEFRECTISVVRRWLVQMVKQRTLQEAAQLAGV